MRLRPGQGFTEAKDVLQTLKVGDEMHIELTERELRYLNRVVNVRLDELVERCARIRRIRSLEDIDTSERYSIADSEIKVMTGVHDKIADALLDSNV